jgi:DNA (cytosine-5)-methyltransferase 1
MKQQTFIAFENRYDEGVRLMGDACNTLRSRERGGGFNHFMVAQPPVQLYDLTHAEEAVRPVEPGIAPTLNARMGTGGNQVPVLLDQADHWVTGHPTGNPEEPWVAGTLMSSGAGLSRPAGIASETDFLVPTYCLQGNMLGRSDTAGPAGRGHQEGVSYTLTATDRHAVVFDVWHLRECDHSNTLNSKKTGGYSLNYINPVRVPVGVRHWAVRRLTPKECERLQAFPDDWTAQGRTEDGKVIQIADSGRYKMLGNSVARIVVQQLLARAKDALTGQSSLYSPVPPKTALSAR